MSKITELDHYISLVAEASTRAKVLLSLDRDHVVFYVTGATKELRVRAYGSQQIYTLMQGVEHCHGFSKDGVAYVYVALSSGGLRLLTYRYFGELAFNTESIAMGYSASYLHVVNQGDKYLMVIDSGGKFHLLSSDDCTFTTHFQAQQIYSNLRDPLYSVAKPTIGIHPQDIQMRPTPSRVTIAFERTTIMSGSKFVGFLATEVVL